MTVAHSKHILLKTVFAISEFVQFMKIKMVIFGLVLTWLTYAFLMVKSFLNLTTPERLSLMYYSFLAI